MARINVNGTVIITGGNNTRIAGRDFYQNGVLVINDQEINVADKIINITIEGDVGDLDVDYCTTIKVNGNTKNIKTGFGDIECQNVLGNVQTGSGDVTSGDVSGDVRTGSGDVECGAVGGKIQTGSGDIRHK